MSLLKKNTKVEHLKRVPLFSECSKAQLLEIASIADELDLAAGRVLIEEGKRGREFYVVFDGDVEVSQKGKKIPIQGGRHFFGEIALLSDLPRTATVTAVTDIRTLVITEQAFKRLLKTSPDIQLKVMSAMADRLARDAL